ncbi:hypothetical protein [uncultured Tessaracoccus sp.]|uniref:hypothetical protein n=1 Tax=uncultured Tessaracoccus sp. TaxID=905023 RepID=UPI0026009A98|nr:hypothetical protein [uncultured Tessaracoccus sp.]
MTEEHRLLLRELAAGIESAGAESTGAFVAGIALREESAPLDTIDLVCELVGLLADLELRIADLEGSRTD